MTLQLTKKHSFDPVFDSQRVYRLILEATANPTRVMNLAEYGDKLFGDFPAFLAVAMTLLDNEVSFHVCGEPALADEIAALTLARRESLEAADFLFVCDPRPVAAALGAAKCGTAEDPHKSATVALRSDGSPDCPLTLRGPGIDGEVTVRVSRTVRDALAARDAQGFEYPQGVDLLFISGAGELFAVPRRIRVVR